MLKKALHNEQAIRSIQHHSNTINFFFSESVTDALSVAMESYCVYLTGDFMGAVNPFTERPSFGLDQIRSICKRQIQCSLSGDFCF